MNVNQGGKHDQKDGLEYEQLPSESKMVRLVTNWMSRRRNRSVPISDITSDSDTKRLHKALVDKRRR